MSISERMITTQELVEQLIKAKFTREEIEMVLIALRKEELNLIDKQPMAAV